MTTETNVTTSFRQYEFCKLCRTNHKQKKKHIYSKRHQDILTNILRKFETKIGAAKQTVFNPEVELISFEDNAKFWCYFCEEELEKHKRLDKCTIKYGSLLQHICGEEHVSKCVDFLWDNIVKVKLKDKYILSKEHYESFKLAAVKAVVSFEEMQKEKCLKEVTKIKQKEKLQRAAVLDGERQSRSWKSFRSLPQGYHGVGLDPQSEKTLTTYNTGLPHIGTVDTGNQTNVYPSIAVPRLQEEQSTKEIGPSMADYQKYLRRKKKKKRSSTENEECSHDEESRASDEWSSSFGSDWNHNTSLREHYDVRPHDGQFVGQNEQFVGQNEQSLKTQQISNSASQISAEIPSTSSLFINKKTDSFKCVPYKRKHSTTTTSNSEFIVPTLLQTPIVEQSVKASSNKKNNITFQYQQDYS